MTTLLHRLDVADRHLFALAAGRDHPHLDRVLPRWTRSADHGVLWFVVAAVLATSGGPGRRAATRGLASLGVASLVANVPAKLGTRRPRPEIAAVPLVRRLRVQPWSTSFPSGHSASAAAFAVGVGLEEPLLALPVGLLALGVAYGRVHTGVHYPGDVLAGAALGAVGAGVVRRVWPVRPGHPAARATDADAPALPEGEGLVVVVNMQGGSADRVDEVATVLAARLPRARLVRADDLLPALREAAADATVLGVMGGDGSVNAAAGIALEHGLPLAVVPGGTLDHFAGELGISGVDDVVEAVRTGSAVQVAVGSSAAEGEGDYFLNTFALGVYPEVVRERERHQDRLGKWPAMAVATARVMRSAEPVEVLVDGTNRRVWTLFAGNGQYHPSGFAPSWRERMDDGAVDVRVVDADIRLPRLRLALALLTGRLGRSRVYEQRVVGRLAVGIVGTDVQMARDGEVSAAPARLLLRAAGKPLVVYRPSRLT